MPSLSAVAYKRGLTRACLCAKQVHLRRWQSVLARRQPLLQAPAVAAPAWALTAATLGLALSVPGLAMFQSGLLRAGSVNSLLLHHFVTAAAVSLLWVAGGFSAVASTTGMAAGDTGLRSVVGAFDMAMLRGVFSSAGPQDAAQLLRALFTLAPAILAPCIVAGAAAERLKPAASALFSALWLPVVYIPVAHAVSAGAGGLLFDLGVLDGAGTLALNVATGFSALMAALLAGARRERRAAAHNLPTTALGTALLAVGWLALIAGSAPTGAAAAAALICTQVQRLLMPKHGYPSAPLLLLHNSALHFPCVESIAGT